MTVITPSYNQGQYLERTIRSVLLQGYPNLEYFIIDGGSTDASVDIIRRYEPWLSYWISEPDKGQVEAINKGLTRSTGEILAWLNSDDIYHPGTIQTAVHALQTSDAGLVCGQARVVGPDGDLHFMYVPHIPVTSRSLLLLWRYHLACPPQPTVFFRREVLDRIGLLDDCLHYALDYEYWLRALGHFHIIYNPGIIADYLVHAHSKTGTGWEPFAVEIKHVARRYLSRLKWQERLLLRLLGHRRVRVRPYLDQAFDAHAAGKSSEVRKWLHRAFLVDPTQLARRGNLSIYTRTFLRNYERR